MRRSWFAMTQIACEFAAISVVALIALCSAQEIELHPFNRNVQENDSPQWGRTPQRNNVVDKATLPGEWDIATGKNVKWSMPLGSVTYGTPVVANGKIYVGTNNERGYLARYPSQVDLGVLLCFRESDGKFLWQHSSEKLPTGLRHDWPHQGIHSSPVVEGDRLWYVTTRGEVVCLDTEGFADGENDGPVIDVWSRHFEVVADLTRVAKSLRKGAVPYQLQQTLRPFAIAAGLNHPGLSEFEIKQTDVENQWMVLSKGKPPTRMYTLTVQDGSLAFDGVGDLFEKHLDVETDLLQGLDDGRMSASLQIPIKSRGLRFDNDVAVNVVERGRRWRINADDDRPVEVELELTGDTLVCRHRSFPDLKTEADVVWSFDMMQKLGVRQHNRATCSPTIWGDILFVCTSNGVDESHIHIPAPNAPSFIALDKHTGEVLWTDNSPGLNIMHGQWSSPAVGVFDDVPQAIFGGGDGWLYSFRADKGEDGKPEFLWKFDGNPKDAIFVLGGRATRNSIVAPPVIHDGKVYLTMGEDPEHGEGPGHLWCIDPTKFGDVSPETVVDANGNLVPPWRLGPPRGGLAAQGWKAVANPNSAAVWHFDRFDSNGDGKFQFEEIMHRSVGSPVIKDDLLVITDFSGLVHCLDVKTGKPHWAFDVFDACWATPLIAGDQIYVVDEGGDVLIFPLSADPAKALPPREINMGSAIYTSPVVANDVLFIASKSRLFAIAAEK